MEWDTASLENIEIGCTVVVILICLMCCFSLYYLSNHQGGLGVSVLALIIVLLPMLVAILSSISYLPYLKTMPPYTVPMVSILIAAIVLVVTARMCTVYWNKYRPLMIANLVISLAGTVTLFALLIVVQTTLVGEPHHDKIVNTEIGGVLVNTSKP